MPLHPFSVHYWIGSKFDEKLFIENVRSHIAQKILGSYAKYKASWSQTLTNEDLVMYVVGIADPDVAKRIEAEAAIDGALRDNLDFLLRATENILKSP